MKRIPETKGKQQTQTHYYMSSLPLRVKQVADAIRQEHAAENLAVMRRFALNMACLDPEKNTMIADYLF